MTEQHRSGPLQTTGRNEETETTQDRSDVIRPRILQSAEPDCVVDCEPNLLVIELIEDEATGFGLPTLPLMTRLDQEF